MPLSYLGGASFSQLGQFYVAPGSRIPPGACNSEKDLIILVQRSESRDVISLWRLQGTKRWEIDVIANHDTAGRVRGVTWSPEGNRFAVGHDSGRVTIHRIQDGLEISHSLAKVHPFDVASHGNRVPGVCGLAWVKMPLSRFWSQNESTDPPPEMYPRGYDSPGSGHYLLKSLPKIDWKTPLYQHMPATSESSTQLHRAPKVQSFTCLEGWPALPNDLTAASIESNPKPLPNMPPIPKDKSEGWSVDESNTMVAVVDDSGTVESLVHGGFAAGTIRTKIPMLQMSSIAQVESSIYFSTFCPAEPQLPTVRVFQLSGRLFTDKTYKIRDLMRLSTSIKTLHTYILTTLKECKEVWFGVPGREGANQTNYKWLRTLGQMQEQDGKAKDPLCDLLSLLLTGRPVTPSLTELIENGAQTTERNYKRWWNTVRDAINSIQVAGERLKTSCDRMLALLADLHGYAYIPDIKDEFQLESGQTAHCMKQTTDLSEFCLAMANTARREARGFQHFMSWLGHQMSNMPETTGPPKDFDPLLVSEYITEHLYPSQLDAFFDGTFGSDSNPPSLKVAPILRPGNMKELLSQAKEALESVKKGKKVDIAFDSEHLLKTTSRNTIALAIGLGGNLREVFKQIEESMSDEDDHESERGVRISDQPGRNVALPALMHEAIERDLRLDLPEVSDVLLREMLVPGNPEEDPSVKFVQYLAIRNPRHNDNYSSVTVIRITHPHEPFATPMVGCALIECEAIDETENELYEQSAWFEVLDMRFYDHDHLAMVIQFNKVHQHRRHLILVNFLKAAYNPYPDRLAQHEPGGSALSFANIFQLPVFVPAFPASPIHVRHSRLLQDKRPGTGVTLAVNSKRKVAVVLDHTRGSLHCYDLSEEDEGEDEDEMEE